MMEFKSGDWVKKPTTKTVGVVVAEQTDEIVLVKWQTGKKSNVNKNDLGKVIEMSRKDDLRGWMIAVDYGEGTLGEIGSKLSTKAIEGN